MQRGGRACVDSYFLWKQAGGVHPTEPSQADSNLAAQLRTNQDPMRKGGQVEDRKHTA